MKHEQPDHMPAEVAAEMLADPLGKLSNRMRKNLRAARVMVTPSTAPLIFDEKDKEGRSSYHYDKCPFLPSMSVDDRLQRKFAGRSWAYLGKIFRRCSVRSHRSFLKARKMDGKIPSDFIQALAVRAKKLRIVADGAREALTARFMVCKASADANPHRNLHPRRLRPSTVQKLFPAS